MRVTISMVKAVLVAMCAVGAQAQPTISAWTDVDQPNAVNVVMGGTNPAILIAIRWDADPVRTTDGGRTWTPFTVFGVRPEQFVASPMDPLLFYALSGRVLAHREGGTNPTPPTLYRSSDAGVTWQVVHERLEAGGGWLGNLSLGSQPGLVYATRMQPSSCDVACFFEGTEAFRSRDGGVSWQSIDAGLGTEPHGSRVLYPSSSDPNVVYALSAYGIFRSGDQGTSWALVRALDPFDGVRQLVVDRHDARTVYVRPDDRMHLWVTEDGGVTWRITEPFAVPGPDRKLVADPAQAGRLYFMGYEGELFESRDRARSWNRVSSGDAGPHLSLDFGILDFNQPAMGIADDARVVLSAGDVGRGTTSLRRIEVRDAALALGSDLWWNPAESGAGWTITQHASGQMFVVWYGYDAQGGPVWRAMPGGTWTDGRTFTGPIYSTRGPAFFQQPFNPAAVSVQPLGFATLHFDDSDNAVFSYAFAGGTNGEKRITRQLFGPPETVSWRPRNYADLWWNAAEPGWGLAFSQQFSTAFATWFVYDNAGNPLWVVMPDGKLGWETIGNQGVWNFFGDIYTTRGPKFGEPFDPAQVVATPIGKASIAFDGRENAILTYNLSGVNETRHLTRQPF